MWEEWRHGSYLRVKLSVVAYFWFLTTSLWELSWLTDDIFCTHLILWKAGFSEMAFARSDISVDVNQYSYHWVQLVSVALFVWWQAIGLYSQIQFSKNFGNRTTNIYKYIYKYIYNYMYIFSPQYIWFLGCFFLLYWPHIFLNVCC